MIIVPSMKTLSACQRLDSFSIGAVSSHHAYEACLSTMDTECTCVFDKSVLVASGWPVRQAAPVIFLVFGVVEV
jgi:hypothetical protein